MICATLICQAQLNVVKKVGPTNPLANFANPCDVLHSHWLSHSSSLRHPAAAAVVEKTNTVTVCPITIIPLWDGKRKQTTHPMGRLGDHIENRARWEEMGRALLVVDRPCQELWLPEAAVLVGCLVHEATGGCLAASSNPLPVVHAGLFWN